MKGIQLLASADFTHPTWWRETKEKLKESKHFGFYEYLPEGKAGNSTYFVLGTEISCIYSQGGRLRRIHCLVFFPRAEDVEVFNQDLGRIGNLNADGRPILGISAKELLARALQVNEKAIFIPAHVWTPWFSLYGSNSGFDSIDECFGDLAKYIYAIETGLSSDPAMNWRIAELDNRSIVSFSDAHSAPKMGREATVFDTDFSYDGILKALSGGLGLATATSQTRAPTKSGTPRFLVDSIENSEVRTEAGLAQTSEKIDSSQPFTRPTTPHIAFTIEFFPEEGKYHFTGHRNCGVKQSPAETAKEGIICSHCKEKLTIGVMHRVEQLAHKGRPEDFKANGRPPFKNLVPLLEILAESLGSPVGSERVAQEYRRLIGLFGSEIGILLKTPIADLERQAISRVAEGIKKVREGDIVIEPGFDGVYGVVKIWPVSSKTSSRGGSSNGSRGGTPGAKPKQSPKQAGGQIDLFE
jgi:PHP family Zn ribbon phosphoesterase